MPLHWPLCPQVRKAEEHQRRANEPHSRLQLDQACVCRIQQLGMGDRVCVDMCCKLVPGEGLLVGNFCRALFLVHSEVRALVAIQLV